jgi:hypothetical protein
MAVVGISAGGFFAVQYHIAFSSELVGAGVVAGGPFYCAQGQISTALTDCMKFPSGINTDALIGAAEDCASGNACDDLANLKTQKLYLYSGLSDSVVKSGVVKKNQPVYGTWMPASNIKTVYDVNSEHCWPTTNFGNACTHLGSPFINNCGYDASSDMMTHIFGAIKQGIPANSSNVYQFSQVSSAGGNPQSMALGQNGYAYVPAACVSNLNGCNTVIALHGCEQTYADIGLDFVNHIGMNEIAEANGYIVIYPQAIRSQTNPSDPEGCFAWWPVPSSDKNYANNKGEQMSAVHNMVHGVLDGSISLEPVKA